MCSENKNEKLNELLDYVRGDYNVFYATKAYTAEVVHSGMIADLLNPKGHHLLGDIPLKKFCKILNISIESDDINVETERKTNEKRFVDIYIKDKNNKVIIIENKINAKDQDHQLYDYYQYGVRQTAENPDDPCSSSISGNFRLYYLSGNKKHSEPNPNSLKSKDGGGNELKCGIDFKLLTYREHILPWVEDILSIEKLYQGHVLFYLTLLQYRDAVEDLVKGEEILLNKIGAVINERIGSNNSFDINEGSKFLYTRLFDIIKFYLDKEDDISCQMHCESPSYDDIHLEITIKSSKLTFHLYSTVLWLMRIDETEIINIENLKSIFKDTPLVDYGEKDRLVWGIEGILPYNTLINISTLKELTPNDIEFLLSDKELYSANFEQIINTLTRYIDILNNGLKVESTQAEQS